MARPRSHRRRNLLGAALALALLVTPAVASAGTLSQVDELRSRLNRGLRLLKRAQQEGNLILVDGLKQNVHATTALLRRCEAILNGVTPDGTDYTLPIDLDTLPKPEFFTAQEAEYTGATIVTPELSFAIDEQLTTTGEMAHAVASFDLAASRVQGAIDAGDLTSALARFAELETLLSLANTAVAAAITGWSGLKSAMIAAGANVLFSQTDDEDYRQSLISLGLSALPDDYSDELGTHLGIDLDHFEDTMLPEMTAVPTEDGDFLADIDVFTGALADVGDSLTTTLDAMDAIVPEPSTGALVMLGLAALAFRGRSTRRL